MATFIILYQPGPSWIEGKPVSEQPLQAHGAYMLELFRADKLRLGGPFTDDSGGAAVIEAADLAEAERIANADLTIQHGVFTCRVHPWALVPWEQFGQGNQADA